MLTKLNIISVYNLVGVVGQPSPQNPGSAAVLYTHVDTDCLKIRICLYTHVNDENLFVYTYGHLLVKRFRFDCTVDPRISYPLWAKHGETGVG